MKLIKAWRKLFYFASHDEARGGLETGHVVFLLTPIGGVTISERSSDWHSCSMWSGVEVHWSPYHWDPRNYEGGDPLFRRSKRWEFARHLGEPYSQTWPGN